MSFAIGQVCATFTAAPLESKPDGSLTANVANMGPCLPLTTWSPENVIPEVRIIWTVRWHPSGLMPVRPVVTLCSDMTLLPKHALQTWVS